MIPVIAIVGRPNVGKSTLFNRITQSRSALVADLAGVTRDRQYGNANFEGHNFIVVDTGGLSDSDSKINQLTLQQTMEAINEADIIFFMVDAQAGVTTADEILAKQLRHYNKKIVLIINKIDGLDFAAIGSDFYRFGFNALYPVAANRGRGINALLREVLLYSQVAVIPTQAEIQMTIKLDPHLRGDDKERRRGEGKERYEDKKNTIQLAIVGRPNVGKSTLMNCFLGEQRVIVSDIPGTTRDSIYVPFHHHGDNYILIDTAGVRRQSRIDDTIEKFSVIKTLQTINSAHVIIFLFNAQEGITDQDLRLLKFIIDTGKALVLAFNKWDTNEYARNIIKAEIDRRLNFVNFAKIHFISALHNTGVNALFRSVKQAYQSATKILPTTQLTEILKEIVLAHSPPVVSGKSIKLNYAHIHTYNPPTLIIHGRNTDKMPEDYQRYLVNAFRKKLKLVGTPIHIQWQNRRD